MEQQPSNESVEESEFKAKLAELGVQPDEIAELSSYMRGISKEFFDSKTPDQVADAFLGVIRTLHIDGQALRPENVMELAIRILQEDSSSAS